MSEKIKALQQQTVLVGADAPVGASSSSSGKEGGVEAAPPGPRISVKSLSAGTWLVLFVFVVL
jgi:hypothetical protein